MDDPVLLVRVERDDDGRIRVLAPKIGVWSGHPQAGALLGPGSRIGSLSHLNRRFALLLPEGAAGVVEGALPPDRSTPVDHAALLLTLAPLRGATSDGAAHGTAQQPSGEGTLAAGTWAVCSPTDGTFYLRPAPDAAPFVAVGAGVRQGQPVGLVEVMKTFNHVLYGGPGLPEQAEVVEVRCDDGQEVRAGQVLVVLR